MKQLQVSKVSRANRQVTYISLSKQEHLALEQIAYQEGRKMNETMRELIRTEARKRGIWPDYTVAVQP